MITIKNAGIKFKDYEMSNVNLEIPKGYITGIRGANGAGKTTLIKMIMGLYPKMSGEIKIAGFDVIKQREKMLGVTGFVSEEREFFGNYSPLENEELYIPYYPNWDKEKYREMLKGMNVPMHTKVQDLSKGNYIKFQFAFALATKPELIILDEPTSGLDPVFRKDFLKALQTAVAEEELTIVIATNIAEDLDKIADYIIDVNSGKCTITENLE